MFKRAIILIVILLLLGIGVSGIISGDKTSENKADSSDVTGIRGVSGIISGDKTSESKNLPATPPPSQEEFEKISSDIPKCTQGNFAKFLERANREAGEISKAVAEVGNIPPSNTVTNLCSLSLEEIKGRILAFQKANLPKLFNSKSKETTNCLDEVSQWIKKALKVSSEPPFDAIWSNFKKDLDRAQENWQTRVNKLISQQQSNINKDLEAYQNMKALHVKMCTPAPSETEVEEPVDIIPSAVEPKCRYCEYAIENIGECKNFISDCR